MPESKIASELRDELKDLNHLNAQILGIFAAAIALLVVQSASLTFGATEENLFSDEPGTLFVAGALGFFAIYPVAALGYQMLAGYRRHIWRIATYLRVFAEVENSQHLWETRLHLSRRVDAYGEMKSLLTPISYADKDRANPQKQKILLEKKTQVAEELLGIKEFSSNEQDIQDEIDRHVSWVIGTKRRKEIQCYLINPEAYVKKSLGSALKEFRQLVFAFLPRLDGASRASENEALAMLAFSTIAFFGVNVQLFSAMNYPGSAQATFVGIALIPLAKGILIANLVVYILGFRDLYITNRRLHRNSHVERRQAIIWLYVYMLEARNGIRHDSF